MGFTATAFPAGKAPTYLASGLNSQPGLTFNGTSNTMATTFNLVKNAGARTMIAVINNGTAGAGANSVIAEYGESWNYNETYGLAFQTSTAASHNSTNAIGVSVYGNTLSFSSSDTPSTAPRMIEAVYSGTAHSVYVNGVAKGTLTAAINTCGGGGGMGLQIGSDFQGTSFFAGEIYELLFFNQALSTTDRQAVEAYLRTKYNLP